MMRFHLIHHDPGISRQCPDSEVRIILQRPSFNELRNRKDASKLLFLVWLWFRSPHDELGAAMMRTAEPPHQEEESICAGFIWP